MPEGPVLTLSEAPNYTTDFPEEMDSGGPWGVLDFPAVASTVGCVATARTLGDYIRQARERRGMTQGELAQAVGVSMRTVGNWERGQAVPRSSLTRVEDLLGPLDEAAGALPPAAQSLIEMIRNDPDLLPEAKEHLERQYGLLRRLKETPPVQQQAAKVAADVADLSAHRTASTSAKDATPKRRT